MRRNVSQNGEESLGGHAEIPRESSTILRFNSHEGTQSPGEPWSEQRDSHLAPSSPVRERDGREARGESISNFPDILSLDNVTITISVIEGRSKGVMYQLRRLCITLGRIGGGADFEFDEPEASDVHCFIAARLDGVLLYAAPSVDNIYVNDQPISTVELTNDSTFRVGSSLLRVSILSNQPADVRKSRAAEK